MRDSRSSRGERLLRRLPCKVVSTWVHSLTGKTSVSKTVDLGSNPGVPAVYLNIA